MLNSHRDIYIQHYRLYFSNGIDISFLLFLYPSLPRCGMNNFKSGWLPRPGDSPPRFHFCAIGVMSRGFRKATVAGVYAARTRKPIEVHWLSISLEVCVYTYCMCALIGRWGGQRNANKDGGEGDGEAGGGGEGGEAKGYKVRLRRKVENLYDGTGGSIGETARRKKRKRKRNGNEEKEREKRRAWNRV